MEKKGIVFDISHYMLEDGPGIRTNVFLKGCFLRCRWCSNAYGLKKDIQLGIKPAVCTGCGKCIEVCPVSVVSKKKNRVITDFQKCINCMKCVKACPVGARFQIGREMTASEVFREVERDRMYYRRGQGGVTLSGGEILMQPEFAIDILDRCSSAYLNTAIETSGCGKWEDLKEMILLCDTVFMDCKCIEEKRHKTLTGVSNGIILENIRKAAALCEKEGILFVVRLPLIPSLNDQYENLKQTAEFVKSLAGNVELNLLPYHNYGVDKYTVIGLDYGLKEINPPGEEQLERVEQFLKETGVRCSVGGYQVAAR